MPASAPRMYGDESYERACAAHAEAQGLNPPRDRLREYGFPCELLQTGGFVMVLRAYKDSHVQVWVTQDSDPQEPYGDDPGSPATYLITAQSVPDPDEGVYDGEEEFAASYGVPLEDLVHVVQTYALQVYDV